MDVTTREDSNSEQSAYLYCVNFDDVQNKSNEYCTFVCVYFKSKTPFEGIMCIHYILFVHSTEFFHNFPVAFHFSASKKGFIFTLPFKTKPKDKKVLNTKHNQKLSNCCENSTILQTSFQFISESGRYAVVAGLILLCFNIQLKSNITQILSKPTHPSKTLK